VLRPASCVLMLYFSYAANLNRSHMVRLCPGAEPLYPAVLENGSVTLRRWFNIEPQEESEIVGGVWRIGEEHLPKLDSYEDWPELYERQEMRVLPLEHGGVGAWEPGERPHSFDVRHHGNTDTRIDGLMCFVYAMKRPFQIPLSPPDPEYLEMVRQGYREWGISSDQLDRGL